jgi:hypothetical protein
MALLGQASGGWTESSSALRLLHVGIRNTVGILATDAFTQTNPPDAATYATSTSAGMDTATLGVLSGSVAFTRGDGAGGSNEIGGPAAVGPGTAGVVELGVFINTAVGNAYENTPGPASGKGPYVSGNGTYANSLYETTNAAGAVVYTTGDALAASINGYLTGFGGTTGGVNADYFCGATAVLMGILKMPNDAVQAEIVYDQRV